MLQYLHKKHARRLKLQKTIIAILLSFSLSFGQSENFSSDNEDSFTSFDEFEMQEIARSWDPLEPYNVQMTKFNDFAYIHILGPAVKGYKHVVSQPIREGVSNAFHNIRFPVRFTNNLLQLKFNNAFEESARFVINSTFGLAGFIDIAKIDGGLERHDEDFGQTLGFYGVGNGIHIVLPLFGPSNLRDTVGLVVDSFVDPLQHAQKKEWGIFEDSDAYIFINAYRFGNEYSLHVEKYENIRKNAIDLYILLKSTYEQQRDRQIKE